MSSLHQDRLLVEGSGPVTGTATTLPTARGKSRGAVGSTEKKATSEVPTQRLGTAQQIGITQSTAAAPPAPRAKRGAGAKAATGVLASRAKAATIKAAAAKAATAKAATVKVASAKAATAKAATAKAATAARAAAVTKVANHTPGVRSARAAAASAARPQATTGTGTTTAVSRPTTPAAKPAAAGESAPAAKAPAAAKPAAASQAAPAAEPAPAVRPVRAANPAPAAAGKSSAPVTGANTPRSASSTPAAETAVPVRSPRPTPHKRVPAARSELVPLTDVAELGTADGSDTAHVVVRKDLPADPEPSSGTERRLPRFLRSRPLVSRRRPALYLSAALAGAITLSAFSSQEPTAQATATESQPVSVAEQLGIEADATEAIVEAEATERLGVLAASRNERDAEQAAAVQVQAEADRVAAEAAAAAAAAAAEAARPKAVLPVDGARLTSGFGARWGSLHAGIDLAAPMHTPEYAAMDGVVLEAGPASGYGLVVYIQHENGDVTAYGHMDQILVTAGQVVRAGETIALLGNRGQSTGPHLHFEVHVGGLNGQKIDPLPWLRDRGVGI